jgi:hypothetical protein
MNKATVSVILGNSTLYLTLDEIGHKAAFRLVPMDSPLVIWIDHNAAEDIANDYNAGGGHGAAGVVDYAAFVGA